MMGRPARVIPLRSHPAHRYALDVTKGKQIAGELVGLACHRYLRDRRDGKSRGLYFDRKAAQRILDFFPLFLRHYKGEWKGQPFDLSPWQQFRLWNVFGWKRADGSRRFRFVYNEVARKNGKTSEAAGVGIYLAAFDGEAGAEVYTAATKYDQAKIMHLDAIHMVKASTALRDLFDVRVNNLNVPGSLSKYEPLGRDSQRLDGLNVSTALIDELHAHPDGDLYDVLETATGARRQPLIWVTTTAGSDVASFCYQMRERADQILRGTREDDALFAYIATLDRAREVKGKKVEEDDWTVEKHWVKANPNLGVSVNTVSLREAIERARDDPAAQNTQKRKRLNMWVGADAAYIDVGKWDRCAGPLSPVEIEREAEGQLIYGGLDLASVNDLAAFCAVVPWDDRPWSCFWRFWLPDEDLPGRVRSTKIPYDVWIREGLLLTTEGPAIDQERIRDEIGAIGERFILREIAFDPWNAQKLVTDLTTDGFQMVKHPGSYGYMSGPTKDLLARVLNRTLHHGGHKVARWMAGNLQVREHDDAVRPIKPGNKMSHKKIDGMVALIEALDRAGRNEAEDDDRESGYNAAGGEEGLTFA